MCVYSSPKLYFIDRLAIVTENKDFCKSAHDHLHDQGSDDLMTRRISVILDFRGPSRI